MAMETPPSPSSRCLQRSETRLWMRLDRWAPPTLRSKSSTRPPSSTASVCPHATSASSTAPTRSAIPSGSPWCGHSRNLGYDVSDGRRRPLGLGSSESAQRDPYFSDLSPPSSLLKPYGKKRGTLPRSDRDNRDRKPVHANFDRLACDDYLSRDNFPQATMHRHNRAQRLRRLSPVHKMFDGMPDQMQRSRDKR